MLDKMRIKSIDQINRMFIQRYERYLPTAFDESATLLQKVNAVINTLNDVMDGVEKHWENVTDWQEYTTDELQTMVDEITDKVDERLKEYQIFRTMIEKDIMPENMKSVMDDWIENGKLYRIINENIFDDINTRLNAVESRLDALENPEV